jgi:RNA ligase
VIYNYTERCQFERAWTPVTRTCRGLIVNDATGQVIARPFGKFFNYGEHDAAALSLDEFVTITDKMDGSLGILYREPDGGWAIATRGSFASEQAIHATKLFRERYAEAFAPWAAEDEFTHLFEIIYPGNRVVLDYGQMDDLVYLGSVHIPSGDTLGPAPGNGWPGPQARVFEGRTLGDALSMEPRANAEGIVVCYARSGLRLKIKQDDYVALHRILTQTTARTVWEFLAVGACKHLIRQPKHWGSRLGIDPARAAEILAAGNDWLAGLLAGVPDEFHAWLRGTVEQITADAEAYRSLTTSAAQALMAEHGSDRKAYAAAAGGRPDAGTLFLLYDGRDVTANAWKAVYPEASRPFAHQGEDVA